MSLKGELASIRQQLKISVPRLSRIANFDDLDPLKNEWCKFENSGAW